MGKRSVRGGQPDTFRLPEHWPFVVDRMRREWVVNTAAFVLALAIGGCVGLLVGGVAGKAALCAFSFVLWQLYPRVYVFDGAGLWVEHRRLWRAGWGRELLASRTAIVDWQQCNWHGNPVIVLRIADRPDIPVCYASRLRGTEAERRVLAWLAPAP